MNRRLLIILGLVLAAVVLAANTFFIVDQRQQVVVVNLGEPVRVINEPGHYDPGLKMKAPFIESVVLLDKRNQSIDARREEVISADQQRLVVDAFVRYRISNPLEFYRTLRSETNAAGLIEPLINSSLRQVLGSATASDIIRDKRDALMAQTLADVRTRAAASHFGIDVIDVRIKRADLPSANQQAVFQRMKSNLEQQAAQIRAVGEQNRREVVAEADKEVTVTLAAANAQAYETEGEGDAQSAKIFAASFGKDPRFAAFYRSMNAYETALIDPNNPTTMVLSPTSDFFKYLEKGPDAH
jgi:membrane protease subunit HflC